MTGYEASARIVRSAPRLARGGADPGRGPEPTPPGPATHVLETLRSEPVETDGGGRLAAIRERWSQLTFFLFDPNSWRT